MYIGIIGRTKLLQFQTLIEIWGNKLKGKGLYLSENDHLSDTIGILVVTKLFGHH